MDADDWRGLLRRCRSMSNRITAAELIRLRLVHLTVLAHVPNLIQPNTPLTIAAPHQRLKAGFLSAKHIKRQIEQVRQVAADGGGFAVPVIFAALVRRGFGAVSRAEEPAKESAHSQRLQNSDTNTRNAAVAAIPAGQPNVNVAPPAIRFAITIFAFEGLFIGVAIRKFIYR
jgi:hypothetical protein